MPSYISRGQFKPGELKEALDDILNSYATEVRSKIATTSKEVAEQCAQKLKQDSPKRKGDYGKSWAVKEMRTSQVGVPTWVVHNKKHYRLTHLLEFGHKARGGTRIVGKRPHIKKVEEWANNEFPKELENTLRKD